MERAPAPSLKEAIEERLRQFEAYNRWEQENPVGSRAPAELVADVGSLFDWLSPQTQLEEPDPNKEGVRKMQDMLSVLK